MQLYESLHAKLESALKEKLAALEDRLNILVQLRDSEERAADSEAFINILKVYLFHELQVNVNFLSIYKI